MKLTKKKSAEGVALTAPLLLGCLLFYAIPFALVIFKSVTKGAGSTLEFVGIQHYRAMLENEIFGLAFCNYPDIFWNGIDAKSTGA